MKPFVLLGGGGGGRSKSPINLPDTLRTDDLVEVVLGLGEGPWLGLANGPRSYYLDQTPIVGLDGEPTFKNYWMTFNPGSPMGEEVKTRLGGFASNVNVGVTLASQTPVVRAGVQDNLDFLEVRFVIQQLMTSNSNGQSEADLEIKLDYRAANTSEWIPAWTGGVNQTPLEPIPELSPPTGSPQVFEGVASIAPNVYSFDFDRAVVTGATSPSISGVGTSALWVDQNGVPHQVDNGAWAAKGDVTDLETEGFIQWQDENNTPHRGYVQVAPPQDPGVGDYWKQSEDTTLIYNGQSWTYPDTAVDLVTGSDAATPLRGDGILRLREKVTTPTVKEVRFSVPNVETNFELRATMLSADSTTEVFRSVTFESFQEVRARTYTWPYTSTLHILAQASDQFNGIPVFQGVFCGRVVRVPTNFDPVTREYDGVWDGTYKMAWTDSLPWICLDFVENDRYGLSRVYPHTMNKWSVYDWAQWSDAMVSDGRGGTRPRVTYNEYITEPREAKDMAQYIAGAGFARLIDDGNGFVDVLVDKDDTPVALFTKENVIDGDFKYSWSDRPTRANEVTVKFKNPDLFYGIDRRTIRDQDDIDTFGRVIEEFEAVGCRSLPEALARARHRLITNLTEKQFVNFRTNRKGRYLTPWSIVLIADPDMDNGLSGRIRAVTGPRAISLRDPVRLEAGITYKAVFDQVNPDYPTTSDKPYRIVERTITSAAGIHSSLTFSADLPTLVELAAFGIEGVGDIGTPKAYRILQIDSPEGDPDNVEISALEVNRTKWEYIDGTVPTIEEPSYNRVFSSVVDPPGRLRISVDEVVEGLKATRVATIWGDRPEKGLVRFYRWYHSIDGSPPRYLGQEREPRLEIRDLPLGRHVFSVQSVDVMGYESRLVYIALDTVGEARVIPAPTGLQLAGQPGVSSFNTMEPKFTWDPYPPNASFQRFRLRVTTTTGGLLRTENLDVTEWRYDLTRQTEDGGPRRSFRLELDALDQFGNASPPLTLQVTNDTPAAPASVTVVSSLSGFTVRVPASPEPDVKGLIVWASQTDGFTPSDANKVFDGEQSQVSLVAARSETWYVRAAYYDGYSKTGLNISAQVSAQSRPLGNEDIPNDTILRAKLAAAVRSELDGLDAAADDLLLRLGNVPNGENAWSRILAEETTRSNADSTLTSAINSQASNISGLGSRLTTVENTYVNQTTSTAQANRISALETSVNTSSTGLLARATALESTRATTTALQSEITRINALEATVNTAGTGLNARTAALESTRATTTALQSEITRINALESSVNTNSASITTIQSTQSTFAGQVNANYFLRVNANGHIGGFGLTASAGPGATSNNISAIFEVNSFAIADATTSLVPFRVVDGNVFIKNAVIQAGSITADKIAANTLQGGEISANAQLIVGTGTNSLTVSGTNSSHSLWAGATDPAAARTRLLRDGTLITTGFEARDDSGVLYFSSAGGFTEAARTQLLISTAARVQTATLALNSTTTFIRLLVAASGSVRLTGKVPKTALAWTVTRPWNEAFNTGNYGDPSSITVTVDYKLSSSGTWTTGATQTFTRVLDPTSPSSTQFQVVRSFVQGTQGRPHPEFEPRTNSVYSSYVSLPIELSVQLASLSVSNLEYDFRTTVSVTAGRTIEVFDLNGSNLILGGTAGTGSGGAAGTFLYLTDTPSSYAGHQNKVVTVNGTGDGLTFTAASGLNAGQVGGFSVQQATTNSYTINTIPVRQGNGDLYAGRYVYGNYFNDNSDESSGTISNIIAQFGDNFYRRATAQKVRDFIGANVAATANALVQRGGNGDISAAWVNSSGINSGNSNIDIGSDGWKFQRWNGSGWTERARLTSDGDLRARLGDSPVGLGLVSNGGGYRGVFDVTSGHYLIMTGAQSGTDVNTYVSGRSSGSSIILRPGTNGNGASSELQINTGGVNVVGTLTVNGAVVGGAVAELDPPNGFRLWADQGESNFWRMQSNETNSAGIRLMSSQGTTRGMLYAESGWTGLLANSGGWAFRAATDGSGQIRLHGTGPTMWLRDGTSHALYAQQGSDQPYLRYQSDSTTGSGVSFYNKNGTLYGTAYADNGGGWGGGIGFLSHTGNWAFLVQNGAAYIYRSDNIHAPLRLWHDLGIATDTWFRSIEGSHRFLFQPNSNSYYKAGGTTGGVHVFRNGQDTDTHLLYGDPEGWTALRGSNPTLVLRNTGTPGVSFRTGSGFLWILRNGAADVNWWDSGPNGRHPMELNLNNGSVTFSGNVTAYSDARLKTNVQPLAEAGTALRRMTSRSFTMDGTHQVGFIAQEMQQVAPHLVGAAGDYLTMDYSRLTAYLVRGWQEHDQELTTLRTRITHLEHQLARAA